MPFTRIKAVLVQDVNNPCRVPHFYCLKDIPLRHDSCKHTFFLTRSIQLDFSILLQHYISKHSRYF